MITWKQRVLWTDVRDTCWYWYCLCRLLFRVPLVCHLCCLCSLSVAFLPSDPFTNMLFKDNNGLHSDIFKLELFSIFLKHFDADKCTEHYRNTISLAKAIRTDFDQAWCDDGNCCTLHFDIRLGGFKATSVQESKLLCQLSHEDWFEMDEVCCVDLLI